MVLGQKFLTKASVFIPFMSLIAACGTNEESSISETQSARCPSAPLLKAGEKPNRFQYRTEMVTHYFENNASSTQRYGWIAFREVKRSWNPLEGSGLDSRYFCTQFFIEKNGQKDFLDAQPVPGSASITAVRESQNYLVFSSLNSELSVGIISFAEKQRRIVSSHKDENAELIPSPNGAYLAHVVWKQEGTPSYTPPTKSQITLRFITPSQLLQGNPITKSMGAYPQFTWRNDTTFEIIDENNQKQTFTIP